MPTTASNFVYLTGTTPASMVAVAANKANSLLSYGLGSVVDRTSSDLSAEGWAKNAAFALSLATSTPADVDLTALGSQTIHAGDTSFALVNKLIFANLGANAVTVKPSTANGFVGPLGGTDPTYTIPAGSTLVLHSVAGWAVDSTHKSLNFDPGANAGSITLAIGGS